MGISIDHIKKQSLAAFGQWRKDWIKNSKHNKQYITASMYGSLRGIGYGKKLLLAANGPSLGRDFKLIKKYRNLFHIAAVDKAFKPLMNKGIKPDYVVLCDANIPFDKYCDGLDTEGIVLLSNVCAETNWVDYWKGPRFFFINKDAIQTEEFFMELTDYAELIPAASNVSNATIVLAHCVLGYDWNLMTGYDYSWKEGEYYSDCTTDKEYWMAAQLIPDEQGNLVRTSTNLLFSAKWIADFFNSIKNGKFINCTDQGFSIGPPTSTLDLAIKKLCKDDLPFHA